MRLKCCGGRMRSRHDGNSTCSIVLAAYHTAQPSCSALHLAASKRVAHHSPQPSCALFPPEPDQLIGLARRRWLNTRNVSDSHLIAPAMNRNVGKLNLGYRISPLLPQTPFQLIREATSLSDAVPIPDLNPTNWPASLQRPRPALKHDASHRKHVTVHDCVSIVSKIRLALRPMLSAYPLQPRLPGMSFLYPPLGRPSQPGQRLFDFLGSLSLYAAADLASCQLGEVSLAYSRQRCRCRLRSCQVDQFRRHFVDVHTLAQLFASAYMLQQKKG